MGAGRRNKQASDRGKQRSAGAVSVNLTGESLIPRRGTWGARPGPNDAKRGGAEDGLKTGSQDIVHGAPRQSGEARRYAEAQWSGDGQQPGRAQVQRVRWNLSA